MLEFQFPDIPFLKPEQPFPDRTRSGLLALAFVEGWSGVAGPKVRTGCVGFWGPAKHRDHFRRV